MALKQYLHYVVALLFMKQYRIRSKRDKMLYMLKVLLRYWGSNSLRVSWSDPSAVICAGGGEFGKNRNEPTASSFLTPTLAIVMPFSYIAFVF